MFGLIIRGSVPEGMHTSLLYGVVNSFVDVNDGEVNGLVGVALPPAGPWGIVEVEVVLMLLLHHVDLIMRILPVGGHLLSLLIGAVAGEDLVHPGGGCGIMRDKEVNVGGPDAHLTILRLVFRGEGVWVVSLHAVVFAISLELKGLKGILFPRVEEDGWALMLLKFFPVGCLYGVTSLQDLPQHRIGVHPQLHLPAPGQVVDTHAQGDVDSIVDSP